MLNKYFTTRVQKSLPALKTGDLVQLMPSRNRIMFSSQTYDTDINLGIVVGNSDLSRVAECCDVQWLDTDLIQTVLREDLWLVAKAIRAR